MKNTTEKTKKKAKTGTSYKRTTEMGLDVENQRGSRNIKKEDEDEDLLDDE